MKRFYDKVKINPETGCHEWTAYKGRWGYGRFRVGGTCKLAHRVAWEMENEPIPEGMLICHHCDNPCCVNPEHLFVGTNQDNATDKMTKGRGNQPKGESSGMSKITREQALVVHRRLRAVERYPSGRVKMGELQRIAKETGLTRQTVSHISQGHTWKHLNEEES